MAELIGYKKNIEVNNQIDVYKTIVYVHKLLSKIPTSITEDTILAYYCAFNKEPDIDRFILENKIVSKKQILLNAKARLKKFGLLVKVGTKLLPCEALRFELIENTSFIICKIKGKIKTDFKLNFNVSD